MCKNQYEQTVNTFIIRKCQGSVALKIALLSEFSSPSTRNHQRQSFLANRATGTHLFDVKCMYAWKEAISTVS